MEKIIKLLKNRLMLIIVLFISISVFFIHSEFKFDDLEVKMEPTDQIVPESGEVIEQPIGDFEHETISQISIMFGEHDHFNSGTVSVNLLRDGEPVESWSKKMALLDENEYNSFILEKPVEVSDDSEYVLLLTEEYEGENAVAIKTDSEKGSVCYAFSYRNTNLKNRFLVLGMIIFLVVTGAIMANVNETVIMQGMLAVLILCFLWVCPPGMAPDEIHHFYRAYEIADGSMISEHMGDHGEGGHNLPRALAEFGNEEAVIDENDTVPYIYGNTALYSPVSYIPQAVGIKIARFFTSNVSQVFYGGKIANAIIAFILCGISLNVLPFGKRVLFMFMILPLTLQELVSIAPDALLISLSFLFFSYILRLTYVSDKIEFKDMAIIFVMGTIFSLVKIIYVILLLLLLLIPIEKYGSRKRAIGFYAIVMGASVLINLVWLRISSGFLYEFNPGVDSAEQIKYVVYNCLDFYSISVRTTLKYAQWWIPTAISDQLGLFVIPTTGVVWIVLLCLLVYEMCSCYSGPTMIKPFEIVVLLGTFVINVLAFFLAEYVQWTPLKNTIVEGIQGRYFIPIIACFAYAIILTRQKNIRNLEITVNGEERGTYQYILTILLDGIILLDMTQYYINKLW